MRPRSLHGRVVDALGARIIDGRLAPGERFTTAWVEGELGVSRSVAREAIRVLESLGLVRSSTRVGCTVRPVADWTMLDPHVVRWLLAGPSQARHLRSFIELRAGLEPEAARLAAARATPEQAAVLASCAGIMAELGHAASGDQEVFLEADVRFHTTLMEAADSPAYRALIPTLVACLEARNDQGLTPAIPAESNLARHSDLARAVADHDPDAAERAARSILRVVAGEVS